MRPVVAEIATYGGVILIGKEASCYGRWDDLWCLLDTPVGDKVIELVARQLHDDLHNNVEQKPISLLAKWMPRRKSSSKESRHYARILCEGLNMTERTYRHY